MCLNDVLIVYTEGTRKNPGRAIKADRHGIEFVNAEGTRNESRRAIKADCLTGHRHSFGFNYTNNTPYQLSV